MSDQGYPVNPVKRGYFLPQDISVAGPDGQFIVDLSPDWYVNTREAARVQLEEWRKRELEAIEFIHMVFQPAGLPGLR